MFAAVLLSFTAGCASLWWFATLPKLWLLSWQVISIVGFIGLLPKNARWFGGLIFVFLIGQGWAVLHARRINAWALKKSQIGQTLPVVGYVASVPKKKSRGVQFTLTTEKVDAQLTQQKLLLSWYGTYRKIHPGQKWKLYVRLKLPHGFANPGSFDFERWAFVNGIRAKGYVRRSPKPHLLKNNTWHHLITQWRDAWLNRLREVLGETSLKGLIEALTLGIKTHVKPAQWRRLRTTGTIHLMAISGLHLGIVALMISKFIRYAINLVPRIFCYCPAARIASVLSLFFVWGYAAIAGFSIPTQRAAVMISVLQMSVILYRPTSLVTRLLWALVVVLFFQPLSGLTPSFWLSFAAVAWLWYGLGPASEKNSVWWQWFKAQWCVTVGLLPLLAGIFHQFSSLALVANLLAVPWMSFIVLPLSLLGTVMVWLSQPISHWVLVIASGALGGLWWVLGKLSQMPHAVWHLGTVSCIAVVLGLLGILVMLSTKFGHLRWLGSMLLLPMFYNPSSGLARGDFKLHLLDVGQGLSAVVQTKHHWLVYDTGPKLGDHFDLGRMVVVPFLWQQGVSGIDTLMVSHGDNDHIGGAHAVLRQFPTGSILTSVPKRFKESHVSACRAGQKWVWDQVPFEVLAPIDRQMSGNNGSCVLKVGQGRHSVLLTGDIEKPAEKVLLAHNKTKLNATALVAPHHGSRTSSTWAFVQAVHPRWVLFPVGYDNRFHFPSKTVLKRYRKLGAMTADTASAGEVTLSRIQNRWRMTSFRKQQPHFWSHFEL